MLWACVLGAAITAGLLVYLLIAAALCYTFGKMVGCTPELGCVAKRLIGEIRARRRSVSMNLAFWLPSMFLLGLVAMGLCYLFLKACEKI
jgi:hypothetical protein